MKVSKDAIVKSSTERHLFVPLGGVWSQLRSCESGGNYSADTGNGYYGTCPVRALHLARAPARRTAVDRVPQSKTMQPSAPEARRLESVATMFVGTRPVSVISPTNCPQIQQARPTGPVRSPHRV